MTSKKKRAFHCGGASWLLLCAMADGAMAQSTSQATPPTSTPLPEITVTAPSPIVRRRAVVPSQRPVRVARLWSMPAAVKAAEIARQSVGHDHRFVPGPNVDSLRGRSERSCP